ncbi:MAG: ABC transporter ATP-binding protein [Caldilineaceae bacterium]
MQEAVLEVQDLRVYYHTPTGPVQAVDGVDFTLHKGERFGLVGESGSGKSTAAFGILRLIKPPARIESGSVRLDGADLLQISPSELKGLRFAEISLIPQGAMNSLSPVLRIREQICDVIKEHDKSITKAALNERAVQLMEMVGLSGAVLDRYPHELSGGMKQRVCIAMAISLRPKVVIADEPTSALDVVTQRQVMETLAHVQDEIAAAVILVGHDMGLMAQFVDTIGVMYAGRLVEVGPVKQIFRDPMHPYTRMLISSLPSLETRGVFQGIPGIAPSLRNPPSGCRFHPRCPDAMPHCASVNPQAAEVHAGRWVACHLYENQ